jgi:hypothetical protein
LDFQIILRGRPELFEEIINPAVLEARNQITEDLTEMREQFQKQVARLRELRIKKVEKPGTPSDSAFLACFRLAEGTDVVPGQRSSMVPRTSRCTT